jgi:hypothetical protein
MVDYAAACGQNLMDQVPYTDERIPILVPHQTVIQLVQVGMVVGKACNDYGWLIVIVDNP